MSPTKSTRIQLSNGGFAHVEMSSMGEPMVDADRIAEWKARGITITSHGVKGYTGSGCYAYLTADRRFGTWN